MFDAVLFDFDGTLVDFVGSDIQSLKWLHTHTGASVCFEEFLQTTVDEVMRFHCLVEEQKIDPLLMHKFRLQNSFRRHGMVWNDEYVTLYCQKLVTSCFPFKGVEPLLADLKQKTKLALITNAYDGKEQRVRIKNSGLDAYFDLIVIAGDIGVYKPDPEIFLHTLNAIGVAPDRSLYVGDSVVRDIVGAKSAGMKAALFGVNSDKVSQIADYNLKSVAELQALLDRVITRAC